jgi:hypothetical protein
MKIIITESQFEYLRRLPSLENELDQFLKIVDPTKFDDFQHYLEYIAKITPMGIGDDLLMIDEYGDLFYKRFRDHIMYNLRDKIKKVYNSGKPGSLYGQY